MTMTGRRIQFGENGTVKGGLSGRFAGLPGQELKAAFDPESPAAGRNPGLCPAPCPEPRQAEALGWHPRSFPAGRRLRSPVITTGPGMGTGTGMGTAAGRDAAASRRWQGRSSPVGSPRQFLLLGVLSLFAPGVLPAGPSAMAQGPGGPGPMPGGAGGMGVRPGFPGERHPGVSMRGGMAERMMGGTGNVKMPGGANLPGDPSNPGPGKVNSSGIRDGLRMGPPGRWWDEDRYAKSVGLTADQRRRMDGVFSESRPNLLSGLDSLRKAEARLNKLSHSDHPSEAALLEEIQHVAQARADLEKASAHMFLQLRNEMTAEQINKAEKLK